MHKHTSHTSRTRNFTLIELLDEEPAEREAEGRKQER
jgi:hypothetical protein